MKAPAATPPDTLAAALAIQEFEINRLSTLRTFDVTVQHPVEGKLSVQRVIAHSHVTDDEGHLSFATMEIDGTRHIRQIFHSCRWVQVDEVGTSAHHASKLVMQ